MPELFYDGDWHLLDASLLTYFPKADGKLASVDEIMSGIKEWYDKNPGYKKNNDKLAQFMRGGGWKKGPEVLSRCPRHPTPKRARLGFGFVDHGNQFEVAGPEWDDPISRSPGRVMSTLRRRQPISGREGWRSS